ncbi:hypothetical protein [Spirosoma sp. KUDC1026]|uniref:hypothetical protein n=1 Tax=Spirosoma sp. KUDC1026 TaxID=2745947 RepID=UPI00159BEDDF|nr:hypothetical protein [Spirosoma sp. KUDC1026]QKZ13186.1 hypothetical protein HU175_11280 [Spirosoma sp. KUDC1026]
MAKSLQPGKDITPTSLLFKPSKKGWNTFVFDSPIYVPKNKFFVGIEIIKEMGADKGENGKQCIGFTKSDFTSFLGSDVLSRWTNTKVVFNGESPMIRAYILQ